MRKEQTLGEVLAANGVSRRGFMKYVAATTSLMALPPSMVGKVAHALENAKRPSVIWLPFQECTGCTESLTRSHAPSLEGLIFDTISLDYQETIMAAAGHQAEEALAEVMKANYGKYLLAVDGSIPGADTAHYSCIGGRSNYDVFVEAAKGAAAIVCIGTCSSYGGIPAAKPNPTGALSVTEVLKSAGIDKPVINVPGCPPIPTAITGVLAQYLTFGQIPELDHLGRPKAFYGQNIHDRCYRRPFYERGEFAETFDDEGAKKGWCLFKVGCKGPVTYNACATIKWNNGAGFPIEAGHGCLGCSEPGFWDWGGFYKPLSQGQWGGWKTLGVAAAAGAAIGLASVAVTRSRQAKAREEAKV
jgi:hydrogenase small subunit